MHRNKWFVTITLVAAFAVAPAAGLAGPAGQAASLETLNKRVKKLERKARQLRNVEYDCIDWSGNDDYRGRIRQVQLHDFPRFGPRIAKLTAAEANATWNFTDARLTAQSYTEDGKFSAHRWVRFKEVANKVVAHGDPGDLIVPVVVTSDQNANSEDLADTYKAICLTIAKK